MLNKIHALLVGLVVCSVWQPCLSDNQRVAGLARNASAPLQARTKSVPTESSPPSPQRELSTRAPRFEEEIVEVLNAGSRSLEPWLKSIAGMTKSAPDGSDPMSSFMNILRPTTSTTTTTPSPATTLTSLQNLAESFKPEQLLETPAKVVSAITDSLDLSKEVPAGPLKEIQRLGNQTSKVFTKLSGISLTAPPESENVYYEYLPSDQWDGHRRPKYFSKECNFRVACEIGRMMSPIWSPVAQRLRTNKIIQDLQSRYSRAMAYGTLYGKCEKYYCVFLQLFGGPQKFVAATAEIVSRIAAPEPADDESSSK